MIPAPESPGSHGAVSGSRGLPPEDLLLLDHWARAQRERGWTVTSTRRAVQRVRAFGRFVAPRRLRDATRTDLVAFAWERARGDPRGSDGFLRSATWRKSADAIAGFSQWMVSSGVVGEDPFAGLRRLPPVPALAVPPPRPRAYGKLLQSSRPPLRTRAMIQVLGHGLQIEQIVRLGTDDVDLERRLLRVVAPRCRFARVFARVVPLTPSAASIIGEWTMAQRRRRLPWLFSTRAKQLSPRAARAVLARGVAAAFPAPAQRHVRSQIQPGGFRRLFMHRALGRRLKLGPFLVMTGVTDLAQLRPYVAASVTAGALHRELRRLTRNYRRWI